MTPGGTAVTVAVAVTVTVTVIQPLSVHTFD